MDIYFVCIQLTVLSCAIYLLPTGMQAHFMVHLEKHWTQTPGLETRRRMCYLEFQLTAIYLTNFTLLTDTLLINLAWP